MASKKMIRDFKPGENFIAFFVLRRKEIKVKRDSNEIYMQVELGDASGRIRGTIWDDVQKTFDGLKVAEVVKVKGTVIQLGNRPYLNVKKIRTATEPDGYKIETLVPVVEKDRKALFAQLDELIAGVKNDPLRELLDSIFNDAETRKGFGNAPGGKLWHHNYLGGLLEHTLSVTEIAMKVGELYPGVDHDLLVTAGLLHDIGKIKSYTYKTMFDFTDEGRLIGHIVIGSQLVTDKINSISDFPRELEKKLIHLILSHQGKLEQASPVVPMTLEGLILYYADELDSKANAFLRIKKKEKRPGKKWSSYVNLMNQFFYLGDDDEN